MSHSHIDPGADPRRRAWLACPNCDHGAGCSECRSKRNCATHWQYLLKNTATHVFLQCPTCYYVWTVDTSEPGRPSSVVVHGKTRYATTTPRAEPGGLSERDGAVVAKVRLGHCPRDILTSPDGELVYVLTTDSVKAINRLHQVVASIPIGAEEPKQMMMSSDGSRIYVTGYDSALSIIDAINMTAKTVGKQRCTAAAVSPDGDCIYLAHGTVVAGRRSASISATRADGTAVTFAAVGGFTTGLAVSPNGRRLYVASTTSHPDDRGGTVAIIDTVGRAVDFVTLDEAPETISVDTEGLLYITHFQPDSLSVVDPGTHCVISTALDDAPMEIAVRPETEIIYTANSHSVTMIDTTTTDTTSLMVGELPRRLCISADGRRLYAIDFAHGTLWCLDTSDNSVVTTVPVCAHPAAMTLSPSGEYLYVTDSRDGTMSVISTTLMEPDSPDIP